MDVRCPQCQTLYEIDEERVQSNDATLKCRECQHLFRLGAGRVPSREDAQRWMLRDSPGGDILYLDDFDTLHEWIVERRVDRTWEISRTGDAWKKLGGIGEFEPIFQAVESASDVHASQSETGPKSSARAVQPDDGGGSEPRVRASTQSQFEEATEGRQTPGERREVGPVSQEEATQPEAGAPAGGADEASEGEVQLETGRFSDEEPSEMADVSEGAGGEGEWSFEGETQPDAAGEIGEEEPIEAFDEELDYGQKRRWPYLVVLLLVVGAAGYAWYTRPGWLMKYVEEWRASTGETVAQKSGEEPDAGGEGESPVAVATENVQKALEASVEAMAQKEAEKVSEAVTEVRGLRGDAINSALNVAKRRAERANNEKKKAAAGAGMMRRAREALQNGSASEARRLYQKVVKRSPGDAEALTGLGWSLIEMGRSGDAISYFSRAREANPSFGEAYIGLARAQRNVGQYRSALETYQAYLSSFPNGAKASIAEYQSEQLRKQLGM